MQAAVAQLAIVERRFLRSLPTERLHDQRIRAGALEFETVEPRPVMEGGGVVDLEVRAKDAARTLIENLMVAANTAMATYLETQAGEAGNKALAEQLLKRADKTSPTEPAVARIRDGLTQLAPSGFYWTILPHRTRSVF